MLNYYKKSMPLTVGVFLSILCVVSLIEFVRAVDPSDIEYLMENIHFLLISVVSGFAGLPLVFYGVEKLQNNKEN